MALILNIETATEVCSVCLSDGERTVAVEESHEPKSHASQITTLIAKVCQKANCHLNELQAVALSAGPGSYTGLRIGSATAKGLCYGLGLPLIAVPTLQAMANGAHQILHKKDHLYCPMIDARRMEVYLAVYDADLLPVENPHPAIIVDNYFRENFYFGKKIIFFGSGMSKCAKHIEREGYPVYNGFIPSSKYVAKLAFQKFLKKNFKDITYFKPAYIKQFSGYSK